MENLTHEEKLRVSIYSEVRKVCREVAQMVKVEYDKNALDLIAELVWKQLKVFTEDLELFSRHAKRSTVNAEDVKLLVRRNPSLKTIVTRLAEEQNLAKKKPAKDVAGTSRQSSGH